MNVKEDLNLLEQARSCSTIDDDDGIYQVLISVIIRTIDIQPRRVWYFAQGVGRFACVQPAVLGPDRGDVQVADHFVALCRELLDAVSVGLEYLLF